jgi:hypothetical protein
MRPEEATTYRGVSTAMTPATVAPPPAGKQATSVGISGKTPPPPPVAPVSPRKSPEEVTAREAVSKFIEAKYGPHAVNDPKLIEELKSSAILSAYEFLMLVNQRAPYDLQTLSQAKGLLRQALETVQGRAEISDGFLAREYSKLTDTIMELERRVKDPRGKPLTEQEQQNVRELIREAGEAADESYGAWIKARDNNSGTDLEPYGDAMLCKNSVAFNALIHFTRGYIRSAESYIEQLDRRAQSPATQSP